MFFVWLGMVVIETNASNSISNPSPNQCDGNGNCDGKPYSFWIPFVIKPLIPTGDVIIGYKQ